MSKVTSFVFGLAWWLLTAFAMVAGFVFVVASAVLRKLEVCLGRKVDHVREPNHS